MTFMRQVLVVLLIGATAACSKEGGSSKPGTNAAGDDRGIGSGSGPVLAPISASAAQKAGIDIQTAGPAHIRTTLVLYGSIRPNAEREQDVRARYPGVVRTVDKRTGDRIKQGEVLLTVESSESLQVYPIRAPLAGQVLARNVNPGDAVDSSAVLMKVADLSTLWTEFAVFARDLTTVRAGLRVEVAQNDGSSTANATIAYVAPAGDAESQSVVARAVINNQDGRWVVGQFVTGTVVVTQADVPISVVPAAIQNVAGSEVVFVQAAGGFEARKVTIGRRSAQALEVLSGIRAGDSYAAANSYLIKAEMIKSEMEVGD